MAKNQPYLFILHSSLFAENQRFFRVILSGAKQSKNCFAQSNISIRKCDLVVDRIGISFK